MSDKVRNGTTQAERLCDTCYSAHIFQGEDSHEYVRCLADWEHPIMLPTRVVRCNRYQDKRDATKPNLQAMQDMAYILSEYGPLKTIGFMPAKEWRKKHGDDDPIGPAQLPPWSR